MTLSFLGEVTTERMDAAFDAAARTHASVPDLAFNQIGSFRRARVAWAGVAEPERELLALQEGLETRLRHGGFELEKRPFAPHATLVRRIERPIARARLAAIAWRASALTLVRSEIGTGRYTILESWPLRA